MGEARLFGDLMTHQVQHLNKEVSNLSEAS